MSREELIATIRLKTLWVFNPAFGRTPTAESKIQARRLAKLQEVKRMQEEKVGNPKGFRVGLWADRGYPNRRFGYRALEGEISAATDRIKAVMGEEELLLVKFRPPNVQSRAEA